MSKQHWKEFIMRKFPLILPSFLVFLVWFTYELKKNEKKNKEGLQQFLKTEAEANNTRKQDISNLDYVIFHLTDLPQYSGTNSDILSQQKRLLFFEGKQMLNLSAYTNTQLKLMYGAANLEALSTADVNFINFSRELFKYGKLLYEEEAEEQALKVLEYGIDINTDLSKHYALLAEIYVKHQQMDQLLLLKEKAENIHTMMKDSIISSLDDQIALLETIS